MADLPPAIIEVYYDARCTPCARELPALAEAAGDASLPFRIILLGDERAARAQLADVSPLLPPRARAAAGGDWRATLKAAGDEEGVLPYARAVRRDGRICGRWRGVLSLARLRALLESCR